MLYSFLQVMINGINICNFYFDLLIFINIVQVYIVQDNIRGGCSQVDQGSGL